MISIVLSLIRKIDIKSIFIFGISLFLLYSFIRIDSLKKEVENLNLKIKNISIDRDNCKKINEENLKKINIIESEYTKNIQEYNNRIKSRDKIIKRLRNDLSFLRKKLSQKPKKVIQIKDCKIPVYEGKELKDEDFKSLYNDLVNIGN